MPYNSSTRSNRTRTPWIIGGIIVILILAGLFGWLWHRNHKPVQVTNTNSQVHNGINYSPPTSAQKNAAGINKNTDVTIPGGTNSSNNPTTANKKNVTVVITTWNNKGGNITVNGYVNVVETGGTCTLTLTKDGQSVTQSRQAEVNADNTTCGETSIPTSKLSPGTWQATLSYSSATSQGTSDPVPGGVTVPS